MTSDADLIEVLFEDPNVIVLSKSAGLLSQGDDSGENNLVDLLRRRFARHYVGLIHRLDRNTSGAMIVAKRSKAAERLTEALKRGDLQRSYWALVAGTLKGPERWVHHLWKDESKNVVKVVAASRSGAKEAVLKVSPVKHLEWTGQNLTLAHYELETGRGHQIRVQSAHSGYPILGDLKYLETAPPMSEAQLRVMKAFPRTALHSNKIRFPHPISKEWLEFEAPLPKDMAQVLSGHE